MEEKELRKMRPLYVAKFIEQRADERHTVTANQIMDYLYSKYEISADRKTIYRDIAMLRDQFGMDIQTAEDTKGYYLMSRQFELDDLRILADCVYSARFISEERTEDLIDLLCELCSDHQGKLLRRDHRSVVRVKTDNNGTLRTINKIREAVISLDRKKISFKYLSHVIENTHVTVEKDGGKAYMVSPIKMIVEGGQCYLMAWSDENLEVVPYRIDRMTDVQILDEKAENRYFRDREYLEQSFNMQGGELTQVELRFENSLLDAVIDKFGTIVVYEKVDDEHFMVKTKVYVSDQFFGWLCGFGRKAKLMEPEETVERFRVYLNEIKEIY